MSHFDEFLARQALPVLGDGDPPDDGWQGTAFQWQEVRELAREQWRRVRALEFVEAIGKGWTSSELAAGTLMRGSQVTADGTVIRPLPGAPSDLVNRARAVLADMRGLPGDVVDPLLATTVQQVAFGAAGMVGADRQVEEAAYQLAQWRARKAQEAAAVARDVVAVHVAFAFRGPGGREYPAGTNTVSHAEAAELGQWVERMEGQARQHGWPAPVGFSESKWPPFRIIGEAAPV